MLSKTWIARLPLPQIYDAAIEHGVPWTLLAAIVQTESAGDPLAARFEAHYKYTFKVAEFAKANAISEMTEMVLQKTSWGLAQMMGGVAREHGHQGSILELLRPEVSLDLACKHIKKLISRHPVLDDMISAYNAGSPIKGLDGKYKNQDYVNKVQGYLRALNETFEYKGK